MGSILSSRIVPELFQLQMGFLFPFLRAKYLRTSLLIMKTLFLNSPLRRVTYARLLYIWYKNIFRMIALLVVFHAANGEK